jgi:hypothetical protein
VPAEEVHLEDVEDDEDGQRPHRVQVNALHRRLQFRKPLNVARKPRYERGNSSHQDGAKERECERAIQVFAQAQAGVSHVGEHGERPHDDMEGAHSRLRERHEPAQALAQRQ